MNEKCLEKEKEAGSAKAEYNRINPDKGEVFMM